MKIWAMQGLCIPLFYPWQPVAVDVLILLLCRFWPEIHPHPFATKVACVPPFNAFQLLFDFKTPRMAPYTEWFLHGRRAVAPAILMEFAQCCLSRLCKDASEKRPCEALLDCCLYKEPLPECSTHALFQCKGCAVNRSFSITANTSPETYVWCSGLFAQNPVAACCQTHGKQNLLQAWTLNQHGVKFVNTCSLEYGIAQINFNGLDTGSYGIPPSLPTHSIATTSTKNVADYAVSYVMIFVSKTKMLTGIMPNLGTYMPMDSWQMTSATNVRATREEALVSWCNRHAQVRLLQDCNTRKIKVNHQTPQPPPPAPRNVRDGIAFCRVSIDFRC